MFDAIPHAQNVKKIEKETCLIVQMSIVSKKYI